MPEKPPRWPDSTGQTLKYEDGRQVVLDEDDAPELTEEMAARLRPMSAEEKAAWRSAQANPPRRTRGKQKAETLERISIAIDPDVVAYWRGTGKGWHTRMREALRAATPLAAESGRE